MLTDGAMITCCKNESEASDFGVDFYRNTPMLASGIKGMRIQLRKGSDLFSTIFMRRRLACPACLQRGAPPPFDLVLRNESFKFYYLTYNKSRG